MNFDAIVNIISETGWTYIYDLSNQLIRVLQGTTQVAEYTYNGAGQRIKKVAGGVTTIFHYDQKGHLIAETNQSGTTEYVYLGDQLLAMIKPGEAVYYFHNDHLGTPQVLTDDTGGIAWKAAYTPFGEAQILEPPTVIVNNFRFPGQYYDPETGLHYNYFRYYNPQTGRYITPDPIGLEGGINLFAYVGNNPVNWVDSYGLQGTLAQRAVQKIMDFVYKQIAKRIGDDVIEEILKRDFEIKTKNLDCESAEYQQAYDEYQDKLDKYRQYREKPAIERYKEIFEDLPKKTLERYEDLREWFSEKRKEYNEVQRQMYESQRKRFK